MKKQALALILCVISVLSFAQSGKDSIIKREVDSVNRMIDQAVVIKNMLFLEQHYAPDFVFTHGTGLIDSKKSWLKNVADTSVNYFSRQHDSTLVELHGDIAIVTGTLTVKRQMPDKLNTYAVRYVRVFVNRNRMWQMISHRTTLQWNF